MSMISGIQGQLLEITVVGCTKLKDTEWISRQDPYVCVEYGSTKYRTRTHTDGGKNPTFQEKFVFTLIEGLRDVNVVVWNSNSITYDDFIGSGKVQLQKVLSQGFDDSAWPLQTKTGRHAGEVRLIMHYANANKPATGYASSAPHMAPPVPQTSLYSAPPVAQTSLYSAPPPSAGYPPVTTYPVTSPYSSYPPNPAAYPPPPYHPHQPAAYPSAYPASSAYPSPTYPPALHESSHYPPSHYPSVSGPFPGIYPRPPY